MAPSVQNSARSDEDPGSLSETADLAKLSSSGLIWGQTIRALRTMENMKRVEYVLVQKKRRRQMQIQTIYDTDFRLRCVGRHCL